MSDGNRKGYYPYAIVFDFGGVLMDWDARYLYRKFFDGDERAMEDFLAEVGFKEWNAQQDAGRSFREAVAELTGKFPHHAAAIRVYDERWEESLGGPIEGTVEILRSLHQAGWPLYGLSNWNAEKFNLVRSKYAFFGLFDAIVLSGEVMLSKPDPRIFELLISKIGRPAEECLLIDDTAENLRVGAELGMQTIYFQSPGQLQGELQKKGVL